MSTTFAALGVPAPVADVLANRGITEPFPIQVDAIAPGLDGRDVCGRAPTGSGKTLAFGIPLVVDLPPAAKRRPRALVLAPTRELADQIADEVTILGAPLGVSVVTIYGGVGYGGQRAALKRGVDVVVACPGRLEDLLGEGALVLDDVERVVLDEADRMADMGFIPAVRRILDACKNDRQTMLFSATLDGAVGEIQRKYQHNAVTCEVDDASADPDLEHVVRPVDRETRLSTTADIVKDHGSTIVFCRTKRGADRVARQLKKFGVKAVPIHGDRSQGQRTRALDEFATGKAEALVATDVAARGIHVDDVACVVHYDPPGDDGTYVHRSGRTGRAGKTGVVVSLILDAAQRKDSAKMFAKLGVRPSNGATRPPEKSEPATTAERAQPTQPAAADRTPAAAGDGLVGSVKFFNPKRGFGFILHDDRDLFVHKSQVKGRISEGQQVRFELGSGPKGEEAQKVRAVA
ncbi:MAG: DEAD/DEAH box helicase [Acidimicrobiales bacterium]|nr:DEAD/DEAH box helicase [Acidimicrobiales bacterium]